MNTVKRDSSIELLRILAIFGIVILHMNNPAMGDLIGKTSYSLPKTLCVYSIESIFVVGVNLFVLISGYFSINKSKLNNKSSIENKKPLRLIGEVIFVNILIYLIRLVLYKQTFSTAQLIINFIPNNYFVMLYIGIYYLSPYTNKFLLSLERRQLNTFIILLLVLFSVQPTCVLALQELIGKQLTQFNFISAYGSFWGYTIIQFMMMYCIGAFLSVNFPKTGTNNKLTPGFGTMDPV